jgi:hypothetical protein
VNALNDSGTAAGSYEVTTGGQIHGFIRTASGSVTIFDPIGSIETSVNALNDVGEVAGTYFDGARGHGFVRDASGNITVFDLPGSTDTKSMASTTPARWRGCIRTALA